MGDDVRRLIAIPCDGETLVATLDEAPGTTALLIVSGGNEIRSGAHRGMAALAARLAAAGVPALRFDRRGVGDSSGDNSGWSSSGPDIAAAVAALRREQPQVARIVGFGNCDAASALAVFGQHAGIDAVVLANPWVVATDDLPPAAAIRRRYFARILTLDSWRRLARGRVNTSKLVKGLWKIAKPEPQYLADHIVAAIETWGGNARIVLAAGDATAIAFDAAAAARDLATPIERIETASHSFAGPAGDALAEAISRAL